MSAVRASRSLQLQAWTSCGRGALFSSRNQVFVTHPSHVTTTSVGSNLVNRQFSSLRSTFLRPPHLQHQSTITNAPKARNSRFSTPLSALRFLHTSNQDSQQAQPVRQHQEEQKVNEKETEETEETNVESEEERFFGRTEKADQASHLNLSARLSKDGAGGAKPGWGEIWRLIKIARPEARTLCLAMVFLLISSAITMSVPYSIGKILDIATGKDGAQDMLFGFNMSTFYLALGGVLTIGAFANFGRVILLRIVGERLVTRMRSRLFRNTLVQNAEFFDANRVGDLISRLGSDTIIVGKSITQNLSDGLRSFISGVAGLSLMAYTSLKLTSVLAFMFPPVAVGAWFYGQAIRNLSRKIQKSLGTLTKIAEERLGSVRTTQAFAAETQEVGRYSNQVRKIFNLGKREAYLSATFFGASGWAGNMTILALLYVGGGMVNSGGISIGELTSFLMYTAYAGSSMFGLSGFYSELMKGVGAASRLFELQDRQPEPSPTVGDAVKSLRGPISFDKVAFSYPTRPQVQIFRDLTFEIEQGSNVAIVAPSGAGKSTVAALLMRFYNPNAGTIRINGKDISTMNAKQLRRKIGYVGQEPVLFSGSIAENIAYGEPHASRHAILSAARQANCTFLADFPSGLDTEVGSRGTQLSGGQKQRIAIARALIKQPDILILDEATSALDAESETLVNQALASLLRGNNTTISIAHRLSTIKRADTIICFSNDGRVAEMGSYAQLSTNPDSAFSKLMEWQMSGGEGDKPAARKRDSPPFEELKEEAVNSEEAEHVEVEVEEPEPPQRR